MPVNVDEPIVDDESVTSKKGKKGTKKAAKSSKKAPKAVKAGPERTESDSKESGTSFTHYVHLANGATVTVNESELTPEQVALADWTATRSPHGHYVRDGKAHNILGIYRREEDTKESEEGK